MGMNIRDYSYPKAVIIKLNGKFSGFPTFSHAVIFSGIFTLEGEPGQPVRSLDTLYQEGFEWLWANYGPSCDFALYHKLERAQYPVNAYWAWYLDQRRLYVNGSAGSAFRLALSHMFE
ncbi:MAG: hypothetical protein N2235_02885 [Fischerella sp.]|nr:hypothetical protein [Fischerella sp.]